MSQCQTCKSQEAAALTRLPFGARLGVCFTSGAAAKRERCVGLEFALANHEMAGGLPIRRLGGGGFHKGGLGIV